MLFVKFLITAVIQISCIAVLYGCFSEQNNSHPDKNRLTFDTPASLRQNRAIDVSALYVKVTVDDKLVKTVESGDDQQWLATIVLPTNATSTIRVAWYQKWQCAELLLATATQEFKIGNSDIEINFTNTYDENHDSNNNGITNLDELNNGTPPADCPSTSPTSTTSPIFPEMVSISAGCFEMGSPTNEENRDASREMQHNVCVNPFSIGIYEVTLAEFDRYTSANDLPVIRPADDKKRDEYPIRDVTWTAATAYASWLGSQDGNTYRLPTEEEWEYATRAGTKTAFNTGNTITTEQARFGTNVSDGPAKVDSFEPNAFGLYNTHGNVSEMTCSVFSADYSAAGVCITTITGIESTVTRGGAYSFIKSDQLRSAARRGSIQPDEAKNGTGFRLVKE